MTTDLVPVDPRNEANVTTLLQRAAVWLSTAVERSDVSEIAAVKAQIATAAEATKQLNLSKEIQLDAQEMVRRAEYALGKAIRKGQAEGTVARREDNQWTQPVVDNDSHSDRKAKPTDFASRTELWGSATGTGIYSLANADSEDFEAAVEAAKAEGNLSRANVARKVKGERTPPRRALPDQFFDAVYDLTRCVERVQRLAEDDRWSQNAEKVAAKHRSDLLRALDGVQSVVNRLP